VRQGGYELVNARITGHFKTLDIALFVDNTSDSHGVTSGQSFGTLSFTSLKVLRSQQ
jgi:hypothetical protein